MISWVAIYIIASPFELLDSLEDLDCHIMTATPTNSVAFIVSTSLPSIRMVDNSLFALLHNSITRIDGALIQGSSDKKADISIHCTTSRLVTSVVFRSASTVSLYTFDSATLLNILFERVICLIRYADRPIHIAASLSTPLRSGGTKQTSCVGLCF